MTFWVEMTSLGSMIIKTKAQVTTWEDEDGIVEIKKTVVGKDVYFDGEYPLHMDWSTFQLFKKVLDRAINDEDELPF